MIKTTMIGNIGNEAKLLKGKNNTQFIAFSVGVNVRSKDGSKHTSWVNASLSEKAGKNLLPFLTKGKKVYIEGKPYVSTYNKDGEIIPTLNILITEIVLLSGKSEQPENSEQSEQSTVEAEQNDDLPF